MAEISASQVKELREMTGLGMMECKKALIEAAGDIKKAEEILRIKSGAKASKAAVRVTAEGVIGGYVSPDARVAAMVELNCETDFVAKNEDFVAFAKALAEKVAVENPADIEALSGAGFEGGSVEQKRQALVQKIGENISIRRFHRVATDRKIAQYLHGTRIGVTVEFEGPDEVGKDVAMHIAFAKPQALTRDEIDPEVVARERDILAARAAESGKPADIAAKMVEGGVNKFVGEITLLGQPFVRNDKETVEKMLKSKGAAVRSFRFFVVGEGLEKRASDFAAEVAAAAATGR